ncbi:DUF547 domain-containing protein [Muriicola marianensis]|uniref:DUF547 domain-containing protein n=1 Tax=Muriicola marianensis TaxID=1324801 RepID=A0ABQ1QZX1_9FLAO|nr:DUF547 domain-containing protein [Muriicola marianensis]GGD53242.1 DUF547 domain-containing protein [Muriicola marianensis]
MKTYLFLFWLTSLLIPSFEMGSSSDIQTADHTAWDRLLQENVSKEGFVDYPGFMKRKKDLEAYLAYLGDNEPKASAHQNEKLAYYINLYNAATVDLILENYPLKSIKDIDSPWGKNRIRVGKDRISLSKIEFGILRKMNEPRIHFAINCASYSCPKLWNKAYTAEGMELQLQQAAMGFINDKSKNRFTEEEIFLSPIFKWYRGDFMQKRSLISYLQPFTKVKIRETAKINYLPYDWSLNEKK